jgi:hypothetical protein
MTRPPRRHIPLEQRLAAALACLLPQDERDKLRAAHASASSVLRLFTDDHIGLHAFCARDRDKWWNLDPRRRGPDLKAKDRTDTSRAAKVKRIRLDADRWAVGRLLKPKKRAKKKKSRWQRPTEPRRPFVRHVN